MREISTGTAVMADGSVGKSANCDDEKCPDLPGEPFHTEAVRLVKLPNTLLQLHKNLNSWRDSLDRS